MKPLRHDLDTTIRPRLLVVAARHAMADYQREHLLPRLLGLPSAQALPEPGAAVQALRLRESAMNEARCRHDAGWHAGDHVLVLAALMSESQIMADQPRQSAAMPSPLGARHGA